MNSPAFKTTKLSGVTFIELLIAAAISSLVIVLAVNTLLVSMKNRQRATINSDLQKTAVAIITQITNDTRWANQVATTPQSITITNTEFESGNTNTIIYNYQPDQMTLTKTLATGDTITLNPPTIKVTEFTIQTYPSPDAPTRIDLNLTTQHATQTQFTYTNQSTISVRLSNIGD